MCTYCVYHGMSIVKWNYCDGSNHTADPAMTNIKHPMDMIQLYIIIIYLTVIMIYSFFSQFFHVYLVKSNLIGMMPIDVRDNKVAPQTAINQFRLLKMCHQ